MSLTAKRGETLHRHWTLPGAARPAAVAGKTRPHRYVSVRSQGRNAASVEETRTSSVRADRAALRAKPVGGAVHLPGARRGREGQRHQARDARARSEIDAGLQLQVAVDRGTEA